MVILIYIQNELNKNEKDEKNDYDNMEEREIKKKFRNKENLKEGIILFLSNKVKPFLIPPLKFDDLYRNYYPLSKMFLKILIFILIFSNFILILRTNISPLKFEDFSKMISELIIPHEIGPLSFIKGIKKGLMVY